MADQSSTPPDSSSSPAAGDRPGSRLSVASSMNGRKKPNGSNRPSVVPLNYADKESLHKAYMSYLKGGGLFVPTSRSYKMMDEMFLLVTLPGSKNPLPVPGKVVWIAPGGATDGMKQGVGIEFTGREGNSLKNTIEGILGALIGSSDPTFTM